MIIKSNELFAARLRSLREEAGLSQVQLAEKLNVSRGSISYYENCERVPDINFLQAAHNFFGVDYNYLLGESSVKTADNDNYGRYNILDSATGALTEQQANALIEKLSSILHCMQILDERYIETDSTTCAESFLTLLDGLEERLNAVYSQKNKIEEIENVLAGTPPHTKAYYFDVLEVTIREKDMQFSLGGLRDVFVSAADSITCALYSNRYAFLFDDKSLQKEFLETLDKYDKEV